MKTCDCDHNGCVPHQTHGRQYSQKKSPVAKIPWLPQPTEKIDFEKSNFCKLMRGSCSDSIAKQKRELYQVLNETFPFYLPKRYHAMECKELHLECQKGQYWANAAHFLYATHAHDHTFYCCISHGISHSTERQNLKQIFTQPVFNMRLKHTVLKNGSAECKTAAEYLLEPWILLQLLTQPIIMYQWALAVMAEETKIRTVFAEIVQFHIPENMMNCIKNLAKIASNLHQLVRELTTLFNDCSINHEQYNHFFFTRRVHKKLQLMLKLYLPTISFVVSDECQNIINALKKIAQNPLTQTTPDIVPVEALKLLNDQTIMRPTKLFSPRYWQFHEMDLFYDEFNFKPDNSDVGFVQQISNTPSVSLETVKSKLISPAEINQEVQKPTIRDEIMTFASEMNSPGLQDSENGVIYNLICLNTSVFLAQLNAIYQDDVLSDLEVDGPEMSLQSIEETLCKAMEPFKEDFIDHVQNKIKSECFSSNWESMPEYKENGAEKIAEHFQERIKALVFKLTLEHNLGLKKTGPYTSYPEVLFIQYLLPCFVASFLDLDKDNKASQKQRESYLHFLHELIKCYENELHSEELSEKFKKNFSISIRPHNQMRCFMILFRNDAVKFFHSMLSGSEVFKQVKTFLNFMIEQNELESSENSPNHLCPTKKWHMHVMMLLLRIRTAAERVGWKGDQVAFCPLRMIGSLEVSDTKNQKGVETVNQLVKFGTYRFTGRLPKDLIQAARKITLPHLQAISVSMLVASLQWEHGINRDLENIQGPAFPFDPIYALWHISYGERWLAKIAFMEKIVTEEREDPTLVTLDFAKTNKCYDLLLPRFTLGGKVKMRHPGEITFVPIKHCRWCGLADVKEFRLCPECKENADYPDVNFFCSENCETEALEKQHMEEHARYLMQKCGI